VALGQVFIPVLRLSPASIIPPVFHSHAFIHSSATL